MDMCCIYNIYALFYVMYAFLHHVMYKIHSFTMYTYPLFSPCVCVRVCAYPLFHQVMYLNTLSPSSVLIHSFTMYLSTLSPSGVLIHSCFFTQSAQEQERSVVTYRPHSRPIGHIVVPPTHPLTVYSCSYDSTLRCCHIEKGVFEEVGCLPCLLISLLCASAI